MRTLGGCFLFISNFAWGGCGVKTVGHLAGGGMICLPRWALIITLMFTLSLLRGSLWEEITRNENSFIRGLIGRITRILMLFFIVNELIRLFVLFERSLIPIVLIVIGWGYQPERLGASKYMVFYTASASMPLLFRLIYLLKSRGRLTFGMLISSCQFSREHSFLILSCLCGAFLVKVPVYFFHVWLPKAHVEAPVAGSILLAAILIKLGRYGLVFSCLMFVKCRERDLLLELIVSSRLLGGALIAVACAYQADIKSIIAYSSVAHIGIILAAMFRLNRIGISGAWGTIVCHAFASSGLFFGANWLYSRGGRRRLVLNKGALLKSPSFALPWALLCCANIGAPPRINLGAEIMCIIRVAPQELFFLTCVGSICLFRVVFNTLLYASTQFLTTAEMSKNRQSLRRRELRILLGHCGPPYLLIIAADLFYWYSLVSRTLIL